MSIAVVNSGASPGATGSATLSTGSADFTTPTAGNLLVAFISTAGITASTGNLPTGSDNLGTTGWTTNTTFAQDTAATDFTAVAYKFAIGTETQLNPVPAAGGTIIAIGYVELSGAANPISIDTIVATNNGAGGKTADTSNSVTTSTANSMVLGGVGFAASPGAPIAWSGTGPMTNISSAAVAMMVGYYLSGSTLSGATFTANWSNSRVPLGFLIIAIKPPATSSNSNSFFLFM